MIRQCNATKLAIHQDALDIPVSLDVSRIKNWIPFGIWGLFFYDDQPPWFVLIECMHILFHLNSQDPSGELFFPPTTATRTIDDGNTACRLQHETVKYSVPRNSILRHLLFRDTDITDRKISNKWPSIFRRTKERYPTWPHSLDHLPKRFLDEGSLRRAVKLLRTAEVEAGSSKRWTSRHLLPLGQHLLFADLRFTEKGGNADRRFMRRTGEMLYLMLGRSSPIIRSRLSKLLRERLLSRTTPWDLLAAHIGRRDDPGGKSDSVDLTTGYLPFPQLDIYDRLSGDWIAALSLGRAPIEDLLDPLMRLSALHLIIYLIYRSRQELGLPPGPFPPFVLDLMTASSTNPVRRMSIEHYDSHVKMPRKAIDQFIDNFSETPLWSSSRRSSLQAAQLLEQALLWNDAHTSHPDALIENLRTDSLRSNHSIWSTITNLASGAGLAIRRRGIGTWYAPDGDFLEALVLANVKGPMEMRAFLDRLFRRYRIIIGPRQALECFSESAAYLELLKANERRLEDQLRTLGFLDRKSDACAFVKNPFYEEEQ